MKKKVLVDLMPLGNLTCGFGQISLNYGKRFGSMDLDDIEFRFLVPAQYVGAFGENVGYTSIYKINKIQKYLKFLLPKTDVWHSTFQQYRLLRLTKATKNILTIHDLNFLYEKKPDKALRYLNRMKKKIEKASVITTISHFVADDLRRNIDVKDRDIRVIYNGVQRIDKDEALKPGFVGSENRPFFFTISQVREKKNFHTLLDVMKQFPEYVLYIAGEKDREYAEMIQQRIDDEHISNVFLVGTVDHAEKVWLYKHCKAFLFPSKFEGFGLPVIEAMQFGKAVFSSSMTSLPEVCGGYAFLWENFEPESMAELIRNNVDNFYRDTERIEAMKNYAFSFSYEKHINEYLKLYRELFA